MFTLNKSAPGTIVTNSKNKKPHTVPYFKKERKKIFCAFCGFHFFPICLSSHRCIFPDTFNSFYPFWNTHGATNKHVLIYRHTHTRTKTHTHVQALSMITSTLCRHYHKTSNTAHRLLIPVTLHFMTPEKWCHL